MRDFPETVRSAVPDSTYPLQVNLYTARHWVTRSSDCALSMALAFWQDPGAPLDDSCIQAMDGLDWR
ncbi:MAG TPA: hypothetical protein VJ436_04525 [Anaerolineales bacterium]|nr:hypothetical protein [Anaerolineales bacterium]